MITTFYTASALSSQAFLVGGLRKRLLKPIRAHFYFRSCTTFHPLNGVVAGLEHAKDSFDHALFLPRDAHLCRQSPPKIVGIQSFRYDPSGGMHLFDIPLSCERAQQYLQEERSMKLLQNPHVWLRSLIIVYAFKPLI